MAEATRDPRPYFVTDERPWGQFLRLTVNQQSTVKIITVWPGQRLSLQRHQHRDELWIVLDVPLAVEIDGRSWVAEVGEEIWIPRRTTHRVASTSELLGRLLEIAFGTFDEEDIERLDDDYDR